MVAVPDPLLHFLDETVDIIEGRVVLVHDEVGVFRADDGAAAARSLQSARFDKAAGMVVGRIFEDAAATPSLWLGIQAPLYVMLINVFFLLVGGGEGEERFQNDGVSRAKGLAPITVAVRGDGDLAHSLRIQNRNLFRKLTDGSVHRARIHEQGAA